MWCSNLDDRCLQANPTNFSYGYDEATFPARTHCPTPYVSLVEVYSGKPISAPTSSNAHREVGFENGSVGNTKSNNDCSSPLPKWMPNSLLKKLSRTSFIARKAQRGMRFQSEHSLLLMHCSALHAAPALASPEHSNNAAHPAFSQRRNSRTQATATLPVAGTSSPEPAPVNFKFKRLHGLPPAHADSCTWSTAPYAITNHALIQFVTPTGIANPSQHPRHLYKWQGYPTSGRENTGWGSGRTLIMYAVYCIPHICLQCSQLIRNKCVLQRDHDISRACWRACLKPCLDL